MNSAISHPAILPFDTEIDPTSVGTRWSKWIQRFENFLVAMNIMNDGRKRALLLHLAGERVHDIYDTLAGEEEVILKQQKRNWMDTSPQRKTLNILCTSLEKPHRTKEKIWTHITRGYACFPGTVSLPMWTVR